MRTETSTVNRTRPKRVRLTQRTSRTSTVPMAFRLARVLRLVFLAVGRVVTVVRLGKVVGQVDVVAVAAVVRVRAAELLRVAARLRAAIASLVSFAKNGNWVALRRGPFAFRGA